MSAEIQVSPLNTSAVQTDSTGALESEPRAVQSSGAEQSSPISADFTLYKNAEGRWQLSLLTTDPELLSQQQRAEHSSAGTTFANVSVARAFPVQAPSAGVCVLSEEGREVLWIESLEALSESARLSVLEALREREFMPEILRLVRVSSFLTPCTWFVQTSKGDTELHLKGEEDIKRLSPKTLLVSDAYGVQFLIKDLPSLDRQSRKLLDRFF